MITILMALKTSSDIKINICELGLVGNREEYL